LRIDPITGGLQMTEGNAETVSVALEYVPDAYSIRRVPPHDPANHIAESISHILLVHPGERDWLPEFGSKLFYVVFDPNHWVSQNEFETWLEQATERWEKRARVPVADGAVEWSPTGDGIDQGKLPVKFYVEFIRNQADKNLVAPFVTARQARGQEYSLGDPDAEGHDWMSRYYGMPAYIDGEVRFIREPLPAPLPPRSDDRFEETRLTDTWLLLAYRLYGDVRAWWAVAEMAIQDAAERGESWDAMDTCGDPEPNRFLRCPSEARLYMEILG
jgi:phage baseplate assembly protein W